MFGPAEYRLVSQPSRQPSSPGQTPDFRIGAGAADNVSFPWRMRHTQEQFWLDSVFLLLGMQ